MKLKFKNKHIHIILVIVMKRQAWIACESTVPKI